MKITREWLTENTKHGAPTKEQLRILGVDWPPNAGWIYRLVGKEISEEVALSYANAKNVRVSKNFPARTQESKESWKFCPHCGKSLQR